MKFSGYDDSLVWVIGESKTYFSSKELPNLQEVFPHPLPWLSHCHTCLPWIIDGKRCWCSCSRIIRRRGRDLKISVNNSKNCVHQLAADLHICKSSRSFCKCACGLREIEGGGKTKSKYQVIKNASWRRREHNRESRQFRGFSNKCFEGGHGKLVLGHHGGCRQEWIGRANLPDERSSEPWLPEKGRRHSN